MEPYNKNKPTVSWKEAPKDKSELLDRLQEAGVPFTAALKYFYDNPEGPASETLNIATDETVPFKWQVRTGNATPASLAEEALLWFVPWTGTREFGHAAGPRQAVRTNKSGKPNLDDLHNYINGKESQLQQVRNEIYNKEPEGRINNANAQVELTQGALNFAMNDLRELKQQPPSIERDNKIKYLEDKVKVFNDNILNARNEITNAALDQLDYQGRTTKDFDNEYKSLNDDYANPEESYVYKQLINEYGPKRGPKYWNEYCKYIDE